MIEIPLSQGRVALIDDQDAYLAALTWSLWRGKNGHEYAANEASVAGGAPRRWTMLHRCVLGVTDPTILVDHRDGNGLDCRRENLRIASRQVNGRNRGAANRNSTTGHLGVYPCENGRFRAAIRVDGKIRSLGRFDRLDLAVAARLAGERKYWGVEPRRMEAHSA